MNKSQKSRSEISISKLLIYMATIKKKKEINCTNTITDKIYIILEISKKI